MAQLRLGYPEIAKHGAEILQLTHSTVAEARLYFTQYSLPFPYLCDAERVAHERYGLVMARPGPLEGLGKLVTSTAVAAHDLVRHGERTPSPVAFLARYALKDSPQAVFVVDRDGVVRRRYTTGPVGNIPSTADLVRDLAALG
jgi:hypothetical protein